jgi:hypothetical protein
MVAGIVIVITVVGVTTGIGTGGGIVGGTPGNGQHRPSERADRERRVRPMLRRTENAKGEYRIETGIRKAA